MLDPRQFFQQTRLIERNVVFLRDDGCSYYQRGVPSLESFDTLLGWHHELRDSMPYVQRLFCLGTSMGAYAAILFGHLLKVEQVWAFAPPTSRLPQALVDELDLPPARADLESLLAQPNGVTRFHVHFNEGCARDARTAARLAQFEGVTLHPQQGGDHNVVHTLMERGLLRELLPASGSR